MSARHDFMERFATVDVDAVWLARGLRQDAQNRINQYKNEAHRYDGNRCVIPKRNKNDIHFEND